MGNTLLVLFLWQLLLARVHKCETPEAGHYNDSTENNNTDSCENNNADTCENIVHVKGILFMMETVSAALSDLAQNVKYRTQVVEDGLCTGLKTTTRNTISISDADQTDHCVTAEYDCYALQRKGFTKSGLYRIWPIFLNHSLNVYCDMETDGGGWTMIQRRGDFEPRITFYETWEKYKEGFGNLTEEFWLGNDAIFALTNQAVQVLRIDLEDFNGDKRYAKYPKFFIRSEIENYRLHIGAYQGSAGDSMNKHNDSVFTTKDYGASTWCANKYKGGWWYEDCHHANLNGVYHPKDYESYSDGINWYHFRGYNISMRTSEMKIRPF